MGVPPGVRIGEGLKGVGGPPRVRIRGEKRG